MYRPAQALSAAALALLATSCAMTTATTDHSGRMRGYVESGSATDFCPDQKNRRDDERCVVTRGWDYTRGVTIVRTYDPAGKLMTTEQPDGADLSLMPDEKARVEALVRADPRVSAIVNQPGVTFWVGGFVMREPGDPSCDRGSRCIRAIAVTDNGNEAILHSVVDLMSDMVVYPFYRPSGKKSVSRP